MIVYAATCKGKGKQVSEDYALIFEAELNDSNAEFEKTERTFIIAVADGVGGNAGGHEASKFVISKLKQYDFQADLSVEAFYLFLKDINHKLLKYSTNLQGKEEMATTLSGIINTGEKAYAFHIGNTRIYSMQGSYLKQLTEDQTTVQWLKSNGQSEVAKFCNKSEITSCMGGGNEKFFNGLKIFEIGHWESIKGLVLTSDGIHEYVDIDTLEDSLCKGNITKEICNGIVDLAFQQGSQDDATIVVIKKE